MESLATATGTTLSRTTSARNDDVSSTEPLPQIPTSDGAPSIYITPADVLVSATEEVPSRLPESGNPAEPLQTERAEPATTDGELDGTASDVTPYDLHDATTSPYVRPSAPDPLSPFAASNDDQE